MEKKYIDKEDLDSLKELNKEYLELTQKLGEAEIRLMNLSLAKENLKQELITLNDKEKQLFSVLEQKYESGEIDLNTGEIF